MRICSVGKGSKSQMTSGASWCIFELLCFCSSSFGNGFETTIVSLMTFTLYCLQCLQMVLLLPPQLRHQCFAKIWWRQDVQVYVVCWGASGVSVGPCSLRSTLVFPLQLTARHQQRYCLSPVRAQSYPTVFLFTTLKSTVEFRSSTTNRCPQ